MWLGVLGTLHSVLFFVGCCSLSAREGFAAASPHPPSFHWLCMLESPQPRICDLAEHAPGDRASLTLALPDALDRFLSVLALPFVAREFIRVSLPLLAFLLSCDATRPQSSPIKTAPSPIASHLLFFSRSSIFQHHSQIAAPRPLLRVISIDRSILRLYQFFQTPTKNHSKSQCLPEEREERPRAESPARGKRFPFTSIRFHDFSLDFFFQTLSDVLVFLRLFC